MNLLSPNGVRVSVSDERGELLLNLGYSAVVDDDKSSAAPAPAKPRAARKPAKPVSPKN